MKKIIDLSYYKIEESEKLKGWRPKVIDVWQEENVIVFQFPERPERDFGDQKELEEWGSLRSKTLSDMIEVLYDMIVERESGFTMFILHVLKELAKNIYDHTTDGYGSIVTVEEPECMTVFVEDSHEQEVKRSDLNSSELQGKQA